MGYENVSLWFAKKEDESITTIDEVNEDNKNDIYLCPMCGSNLRPKAVKSKQVTSHFAHVDVSKCNSETMIHWWFKNKFIEKGDVFSILTNKEKQYVCREVLLEQSYNIDGKIYRPDITIVTECGSTVYFEMNYSNKKKIENYLDIWLELKNVVVEVDIKTLINKSDGLMFKALFYDGKCFNTKKNDMYYNIIGKYKEKKFTGDVSQELKNKIKKLDWFWNDIFRYKKGEVDIGYMVSLIDCIDGEEKEIVNIILNKPKCMKLYEEYVNFKVNEIYKPIINMIKENYGEEFLCHIEKSVHYERYDKCYKGYLRILDVSDDNWCSYDIDRYDIDYLLKESDKRLKKNIAYSDKAKLIHTYNTNVQSLREKILNCKLFQEYQLHLESLTNNDFKYQVKFEIKELNRNPRRLNKNAFNFNEFDSVFYLECEYEEEFKIADELEIKINVDTGIEYICNLIINKFSIYFKNLDRLSGVEELKVLTKELQTNYLDFGIKIDGEIHFEDVYNIWAFVYDDYLNLGDEYYISNKGVLSGKGDLIFETNEINEIKKYLTQNINKLIKDEVTFECGDCDNKYTLEFGEIKFYRKKGFDFPRRCKRCRKLRKQNKNN